MESDKKVGCNAVFQRDPQARITHLLINTCVCVCVCVLHFYTQSSGYTVLHGLSLDRLEIILSFLLTDFDTNLTCV
jgi:hypothetical protein